MVNEPFTIRAWRCPCVHAADRSSRRPRTLPRTSLRAQPASQRVSPPRPGAASRNDWRRPARRRTPARPATRPALRPGRPAPSRWIAAHRPRPTARPPAPPRSPAPGDPPLRDQRDRPRPVFLGPPAAGLARGKADQPPRVVIGISLPVDPPVDQRPIDRLRFGQRGRRVPLLGQLEPQARRTLALARKPRLPGVHVGKAEDRQPRPYLAHAARAFSASAASAISALMISASGSSFVTMPTDCPAITLPCSTSPSITARLSAPAQ